MLTASRAFRSPVVRLAKDCCAAPRVCAALRARKGTRSVATSAAITLDPIIQGYATELQQKQPCFSMPAKNVRILSEPQTFYQTLLVGRVFLCVGDLLFRAMYLHSCRTKSDTPKREYLSHHFISERRSMSWYVKQTLNKLYMWLMSCSRLTRFMLLSPLMSRSHWTSIST